MKNSFVLFGYTLCLANLLPLLWSSLHVLYFVPFLIIVLYRFPLNKALWWSLACGLIVDLLSSQTRLGIYAFNYCLITYLINGYKTHFFEDRFSTLPVMVFVYTALSNLLQGLILFAIGMPFPLSREWLFYELLFIPIQTALYGLLAFGGMLRLYQELYRRFLLRRSSRRKG